MKRILFVCHGNICRSAAAEYLFRDMAKKAGRDREFAVDSAAVSTEEAGSPVYPPMRKLLSAEGIDCSGHRARQITRSDYENFDMILAMDGRNLRSLERLFPGDPAHKITLLSEYGSGGEIEDPWYTGNFEKVFCEIRAGLEGLLKRI